MIKGRYCKAINVFIVLCACVFSFTGCKKRLPPLQKGVSPINDSAVTVDITNDVPEVRVLEEFNDESVSVGGPEEVSVKADSGAFVSPTPKEIQAALKNAGYYTGAIDGKIGPKSQQAIRDFQRDSRLTVDGKVGKKTWAKLKEHLNEAGN